MITVVLSSKSTNPAAHYAFHPLSCCCCNRLRINNCRSVSSLVTSHSGWQNIPHGAGNGNVKVRGNTELILLRLRALGHIFLGEDGLRRRGLREDSRLSVPREPWRKWKLLCQNMWHLISHKATASETSPALTTSSSDDSMKTVPDDLTLIQQKVTKLPID